MTMLDQRRSQPPVQKVIKEESSGPTETTGGGRGVVRMEEPPSNQFSGPIEKDGESLCSLLESVRPMVYRWAEMKTQDPDDAEDVTQKVLLKVFTKFHTFRREGRLSTWLYRITMNESSGFRRQANREREKASAWFDLDGRPSMNGSDIERIDRMRTLEAVLNVACRLPPLQLTSFRLVDLDGLRPCEAAEELGRRQANIRSSLCRARMKIREFVGQARKELVEDLTLAE